jgi:hypothetical protein
MLVTVCVVVDVDVHSNMLVYVRASIIKSVIE